MKQQQGKKVSVTQVRGQGGQKPEIRRTLEALGLGPIGRTREFTLNPCLTGMLKAVRHLVEVRSA